LPDFTTIGHLTAAGVGLLMGIVLRPPRARDERAAH
jgi:hypothetical protein